MLILHELESHIVISAMGCYLGTINLVFNGKELKKQMEHAIKTINTAFERNILTNVNEVTLYALFHYEKIVTNDDSRSSDYKEFVSEFVDKVSKKHKDIILKAMGEMNQQEIKKDKLIYLTDILNHIKD